jgi:hypothetical protein
LAVLSAIVVTGLLCSPASLRAADTASPATSNAPATGELTPLQAQTDFDTLRQALEEAHAGLYRHSTEAGMNRRFEAHRTQLNQPMSRIDFIGIVSEMLADIRCGHQGILEQASGKFPFLGKVIVLMDGRTFSTAADVCATLHHLKRATFVGEESGGGYCGNTSGLGAKVVLPNSKLSSRIPMWGYWNARRQTPGHPARPSGGYQGGRSAARRRCAVGRGAQTGHRSAAREIGGKRD